MATWFQWCSRSSVFAGLKAVAADDVRAPNVRRAAADAVVSVVVRAAPWAPPPFVERERPLGSDRSRGDDGGETGEHDRRRTQAKKSHAESSG